MNLIEWISMIAATALFVAMHWGAQRWVSTDFGRAFALSRGVAAVVLAAVGIAALADGADRWRTAFIYRQAHDDWMRLGVLVVYGHLIADYAWMAVGRFALGAAQRKDLLVHHLLALVALGLALHLEVGYALALIAMITELLPVTSGLKALGKTIESEALTRAAERSHLQVLAWVRMPLWLALLALVLSVLLGDRGGDLAWAFIVAGCGLVMLITLDSYWIWECRQKSSQSFRSFRVKS